MTESHVNFLHKIVSNLPQSEDDENLRLLRSFYLMRCKENMLENGLPVKHFSSKTRCSRCCLEWDKRTVTKIKPIKLSSRQKRKLRTRQLSALSETDVDIPKALLESNQMEQTCSFCKHTTVTTIPKPVIEYPKKIETSDPFTKTITKQKTEHKKSNKKSTNSFSNKIQNKHSVESTKISTPFNVYSNAIDVFSLKNKQNTLASTIKEAPKIIKNNKKKKDKFAGLCQKAVLASAKSKQNKRIDKPDNKLSLFLKPSSG